MNGITKCFILFNSASDTLTEDFFQTLHGLFNVEYYICILLSLVYMTRRTKRPADYLVIGKNIPAGKSICYRLDFSWLRKLPQIFLFVNKIELKIDPYSTEVYQICMKRNRMIRKTFVTSFVSCHPSFEWSPLICKSTLPAGRLIRRSAGWENQHICDKFNFPK